MPLEANLKLSTDRPIVIHPHYEDVELRMRVKKVYSHLYGYRPVRELHEILKNELHAKYLITESYFCVKSPPGKPECGMSRVSHIDMEITQQHQACVLMLQQTADAVKYFRKVFEFKHVSIFKIL